MCGIAGALSTTPDARVPRIAERLTAALRHRGPDGEAFWADTLAPPVRCSRGAIPSVAGIVLGHRRLSIVDLATGDQPIANEDGSVWVAFNGEIYNQLDLRRELEASGHRFVTRADTEVLVHGWEEWGEGLFPRLNGIFAFALSDRRRDVTVLVRDPIGVKPLFLGVSDGLTWWSSELGAARASGILSGEVSRDALKLFLLFRFIPSPASIHRQAWKIPPGHYVVLRAAEAGREPVFRRYQTTVRSSAAPRGQDEWRDALIAELDASVTRQLMSDVPVGSLLSGGVDSTLVTSMMKHRLPVPPQAFGIGFRSHGADSEALAGEWAAARLGVPFSATRVEDADYLAAWPAAFAQVGEPISNSGGLLVYLLCQAVARTHKVVLSGQGADEPLGGYPRHMAERLRHVGAMAPRFSAWAAERIFGAGAGGRLARVLRAADRLDRYLEIFAVLEPASIDALVPGGTPARALGRAAIETWVGDPSGDDLNDLLRADARLSLADDLLMIADHFSMRASVELRVPFLDLAFLELAERMPSRYKVSRIGERKWLYRRGAARALPPVLARRLCGVRAGLGRKAGFSVRLEPLFAAGSGALGDVRTWLEPLTQRGLVSSEVLTLATRSPRAGPLQRELLALYTLSRWMELSPS